MDWMLHSYIPSSTSLDITSALSAINHESADMVLEVKEYVANN